MRKLKTNYKNGEKFYAEDMNLVTSTINEIEDVVTTQVQEVTYDELKTLRDNSGLTPGMKYRITDYVTTTTQTDTRSAGHQFDIMVSAIDSNTLNETAGATRHAGDTYFVSEPIRYHEDYYESYYSGYNDFPYAGTITIDGATYYKWGSSEGSWGGMFYLLTTESTYTNSPDGEDDCGEYYLTAYPIAGSLSEDGETTTEFYEKWLEKKKSIIETIEDDGVKYLRICDAFDCDSESIQTSVSPKLESWEIKYCIDNDVDRFIWADTENGKGVIYYMKDEHGNELPYDFKNIQFKRVAITGIESTGVTGDVINSLTDLLVYGSGNTMCYGIQHDDSYTPSDVSYTTGHDSHDIAIHFIFDDTITEWYYTFGMSSDNTLNGGSYRNVIGVNGSNIKSLNNIVFGNACYDNTFGGDCYDNTIGNNFWQNSIGNNVHDNSIGNGFQNNTIGNVFQNNTIGNNFWQNSIGNEVYYNSIGNDFGANTIGNYFRWNTIGNGFGANTIGNYFTENSIGNEVYRNTIGNDVYNNSIGNGFGVNTIGNNVYYNSIGNNVHDNSIGNGFTYNSIGNDFQKNTVNEGVNNIDFVTNYSSDTIQYLTILNGYGYGSLTAVPTGIAANASYPQMIGFNTSGNFVVKNVLD